MELVGVQSFRETTGSCTFAGRVNLFRECQIQPKAVREPVEEVNNCEFITRPSFYTT